jgi:hypothetical protein
VLFNTFTDLLAMDTPFDPRNRSKNTQVMLVREGSGSPLQDAAYWIVYNQYGNVIEFLTGSFDSRNHSDNENTKYFVPDACAQCHGGAGRLTPQGQHVFPTAALNPLDTDHWFDRIAPGDDFPTMAASNYPVLFDAGSNDMKSSAFAKAFDKIRQINTEIRDQNRSASPYAGRPSFQLRIAQNWLDRHANTRIHLAPIDRPLPPLEAGDAQWTKNAFPDEVLLPLLNRYCYRCHSSIRYNVFDKKQVMVESDNITLKINVPPKPPRMPQDRELPAGVRTKLLEYLDKLPH